MFLALLLLASVSVNLQQAREVREAHVLAVTQLRLLEQVHKTMLDACYMASNGQRNYPCQIVAEYSFEKLKASLSNWN